MAIVIDPSTQRIVLDTFTVTATEIYSAWVSWAALSDNLKYGMVIRQVGSDDLGGGLNIPPYFFLQGLWRVRPAEADGLTVITGNLFVDGGGSPVVPTLGNWSSQVQFTVPVQAQGFDSGAGGGSTLTAAQVWAYGSRSLTTAFPTIPEAGLTPTQAAQLLELWRVAGLDAANPMTVTPASRAVADIAQTISGDPTANVVVTRS